MSPTSQTHSGGNCLLAAIHNLAPTSLHYLGHLGQNGLLDIFESLKKLRKLRKGIKITKQRRGKIATTKCSQESPSFKDFFRGISALLSYSQHFSLWRSVTSCCCWTPVSGDFRDSITTRLPLKDGSRTPCFYCSIREIPLFLHDSVSFCRCDARLRPEVGRCPRLRHAAASFDIYLASTTSSNASPSWTTMMISELIPSS